MTGLSPLRLHRAVAFAAATMLAGFALPALAAAPMPPPSAAPKDDGQWVMPAKNYASTRFSGLNEINTDNVKNLRVAMTFSLGTDKGAEAAPLVVNGTMYIITPWP